MPSSSFPSSSTSSTVSRYSTLLSSLCYGLITYTHSYESTVITEDLRHTNLQRLITDGLNYTHNDTLIRSYILPSTTQNFPSSLVDPWFSSIEHTTNSIPIVSLTTETNDRSDIDNSSLANASQINLRRGPLIGYNRTVDVCTVPSSSSSSSVPVWSPVVSYTYDVSSTWLYVTEKIRIPVTDLWYWLRDDLNKEYCWSIRQLPPYAYLHQVTSTDSSFSSASSSSSTSAEFNAQISIVVHNLLKEHNLPVDQSITTEITDRELIVTSILTPSSPSESSSSPSSSLSACSSSLSACTPGTVRIRFTEWSFPSTEFEIIARLALVNDTWLQQGKQQAHALGIPSALDPPPSSIVRPFSSIVPIDLTYREWTRDQIYTKQLHADNRMYYQDIITFGRELSLNKSIVIDEDYLQSLTYGQSYFPTGLFSVPIHWATRSKWYPPVIPSLESIYTPLSPPDHELVWNLIHWHPSWLVHEYDRIQAKDARSPPLSSYVIAERQFPPQDFLGKYFGEGKGIAIFIFFCISVVILLSFGIFIVEQVKK